MKPYKFGAPSGRGLRKLIFFAAITGALLLLGGLLGGRWVYQNNLEALDPNTNEIKPFSVEAGETLPQVADKLEEAEVIKAGWAFEQYVRSKGLAESFKAGTYRLSANMDVPLITTILSEGKVASDLFTILPGKRIDQIKQRFAEAGFNDRDINAALDPAQYAGHPALVDKPAEASLEGYLYPDSYQLIDQTTPQTIVKQALDEMNEALTPDIKNGIKAQGLSVHEGIILASIVEQEIPAPPISQPDDRNKAAQVFLKRLSLGMVLGSDVTAIYGAINANISLPDNTVEAISKSIAYDSPYNTRKNSGLPPGPIGNVTSDGLQAVGQPTATDYLYFVAGDGEYKNQTFFTRTLEEHNAAVDKYCNELCN